MDVMVDLDLIEYAVSVGEHTGVSTVPTPENLTCKCCKDAEVILEKFSLPSGEVFYAVKCNECSKFVQRSTIEEAVSLWNRLNS